MAGFGFGLGYISLNIHEYMQRLFRRDYFVCIENNAVIWWSQLSVLYADCLEVIIYLYKKRNVSEYQ